MDRNKTEIEVSLILRNAKLKREAKAALIAPAHLKALHFVGLFGAIVVSSFAINEIKAGPFLSALLTGASVGLVGLSIEFWSVNRRLDAAIQLLSLEDSLSDQGLQCDSNEVGAAHADHKEYESPA